MLNTDEKTAIFRIAFDLIKADEIIESGEIGKLNDLKEQFKITDPKVKKEAQELSFSQAVERLRNLPLNLYGKKDEDDVKTLLKWLEDVTLADGSCMPSEAILLEALRCCLLKDTRDMCSVMSSNSLGAKVAPMTVLYVEGQNNGVINSIIANNYREIVNEFRLAGFDFIYIPKVAEKFKRLNENFLRDVISNLAPTLNDEDTDKIYHGLCNLSTSDFCRSVLINKLALPDDIISEPALLIKIGESTVANKRASKDDTCDDVEYNKIVPEYLKIELSEDPINDIRNFVDEYRKLLSADQVLLTRTKDTGWFVYSGFYRTFFDMLAYPGRKVESRVVIDLTSKRYTKILLPEINEEISLGSAKQRTIYILVLLYRSLNKVANLNSGKTVNVLKQLYDKIGSGQRDYGDPEVNLTQDISRIRNTVSKITLLKYLDKYTVERNEKDKLILSTGIDPKKIFVTEDGKNEIPLSEYDKWTKLVK